MERGKGRNKGEVSGRRYKSSLKIDEHSLSASSGTVKGPERNKGDGNVSLNASPAAGSGYTDQ